jgi:adenylate kinase family enzyme
MTHVGQRIVVVGTTGSGKTTVARQLAQRLGCPFVELDALFWGPNWIPVPLDLFRERTAQALSGDAWTVGGNYGAARDIVWGRADTLVWLDYPLRLILWQLFRRTIRRIVTQEELWNGNRETFRGQFLSRDSLFVWALDSHARHRREYLASMQKPEYAHLKWVRLHSQRETRNWLAGLMR